MERVYLTYLGHCMEIPQGDSIVGRGISCRVRFNDPSLSRVHCRLRVQGTRVSVTDLSSTNGTEVNGRKVSDPTELQNGDTLQIGDRELTLVVSGADSEFDESTVSYAEMPPLPQKSVEQRDSQQRCPECKEPVSTQDDFCGKCGYTWADFRPGAVTQNIPRIELSEQGLSERRRHARHRVRVPALYTCGDRTIETLVVSISRGGAFVCTQAFDPVGTECELTVMADGAPALAFQGRVAYVVDKPGQGTSLGLGIEFVDLGPAERRWLDDTIARLGSA